jgi:transposase
MAHHYIGNGITTLSAASDVPEGKVIGRCIQRQRQRQRHDEFIRFLNTIEAEVPAGKVVQVILDNYATYKHAMVVQWLERHPRFVFHVTSTSASWLNAVESFFAKLTKRRLRRSDSHSLVALQTAVKRFAAEANTI